MACGTDEGHFARSHRLKETLRIKDNEVYSIQADRFSGLGMGLGTGTITRRTSTPEARVQDSLAIICRSYSDRNAKETLQVRKIIHFIF